MLSLLLLFAVLAAAFSFGGLKSAILHRTFVYEKAKTETVYATVPATAMAIYAETVYKAGYTGVFTPSAEPWESVGVGGDVGVLKTETTDFTTDGIAITMAAKSAGIVCFQLDGLEEIVTPDGGEHMEIATLDRLLSEGGGGETAETTVNAGDPVFKILDVKREPYLYLRLKEEDGPAAQGKSLRLLFGEGKPVTAAVLRSSGVDAGYGFLLKLPVMPADFYRQRLKSLEVVTGSHSGVAIPTAAIAKRAGETGVFANEKGIAVFLPVAVQKTVGDRVLVTGLPPGTYYIANPGPLKTGQILQ